MCVYIMSARSILILCCDIHTKQVSSWALPHVTHLYICNGAWEFGTFPYTPVVPKLLACAGDTTYSPGYDDNCDDNCDDNKGHRQWQRKLYHIYLNSQPLPVPEILICLFQFTNTVQKKLHKIYRLILLKCFHLVYREVTLQLKD